MTGAERHRLSTTIDPTVLARLYAIKDRLGLSIAEQIERGASLWLDTMEWPAERLRPRDRERGRPDRSRSPHAPRNQPPTLGADWSDTAPAPIE